MDEVVGLLQARTGIAIPGTRRDAVARTIDELARKAGCEDLGAYLGRLRREPAVFAALVAALAIGETYFFREPAQFEALRVEVLPRLRAERPPGHTLRVWSAGCSTGEEAYSLAIVLAEAWPWAFSVIATDLVDSSLARARAGRYTAWSLRGVGEAALDRYFVADGDVRVIRDAHRVGVTFAPGNLRVDRPAGFDVVFCRNVLVYFDEETVREVGGALYGALVTGGFLFTASTDPQVREAAAWEPVMTAAGVVLRRPSAVVAAPEAVTVAAAERGEPGPVARSVAADDEGEAALARIVTLVAAGREAAALTACEAELRRHRLTAGLHHVHALLLLEVGRLAEAEDAARRAVYLDRTLILGHVAIATIARCRGRAAIARRSLRNAADLLARVADDAVVPLADEATAAEVRTALAWLHIKLARQAR